MLRWFYANEELICQKRIPSDVTVPEIPSRDFNVQITWRFCVKLKEWELLPNEVVAVSGDCDELGNWDVEKCFQMEPANEESPATTWHAFVNLFTERDVSYRYIILAIDPTNNRKIIRFFESHLKTRIIPAKSHRMPEQCEDLFGYIDDEYKVERGWLTTERIVQFMFSLAYFNLQNTELPGNTLSVKVTPLYRKGPHKCGKLFENDVLPPLIHETKSMNSVICEPKIIDQRIDADERLCKSEVPSYTKLDLSAPNQCLSDDSIEEEDGEEHAAELEETKPPACAAEVGEGNLSTAFAFNESVNAVNTKGVLRHQPEFGTKFQKDDVVTIHLTIGDFKNTVYLIEIFMFSRFDLSEHPFSLGYRYVLPEDFLSVRQGYMEIPIICESKHRPFGFITFRFLIVDPLPKLKFNLASSYVRHWRKRPDAMICGHRGMGITFTDDDGILLYENTIYSMNLAISNGVDMIEFDVHLTKDLIPVIHHDFNVHVSLRDQKLIQNFNNINIPISKFTYNELMDLKIYDENETPSITRIRDAKPRLKLFPKLADVLTTIAEGIAMDIEIKSPQQFCGSKWEEDIRPLVDHNTLVDRVLDVVIRRSNKRRIVFSSFDADVVTLLRFKQNLYPIVLNINDDDGPKYLDPRVRNPRLCVNFARNMELLGVAFKACTILKNLMLSKQCDENELTIFVFGVDSFEYIKDLKHWCAKVIILDRIDKFVEFQNLAAINALSSVGESQQEKTI